MSIKVINKYVVSKLVTNFKKINEKIKKFNVKWIRLQFCNPFGLIHQLSIPAHELTPESFVDGFPLDGSSILGFTEIDKSDIILIPDPFTFVILPDYFDSYKNNENSYISKSARMFANIHLGFDGGRYSRDSRYISEKTVRFAEKNGFSSNWAAEMEFFVFDIPESIKKNSQITSNEAPWGSPNLEDVIQIKKGYYRDSPSDTLTNFRDEVCDVLETFGIKIKAHHHEVATAGQSEIVLSHTGLTEMADAFVTGVKTVREIASKREMVASFNPKPIPNDNGSAVHVNQSLWKTKNKKKYNVFYDPSDKYAELSQTAYYYIGGLLEHARSLCAITNPTAQSYKRLVPGYEAPTNIAWGKMNRSVSVRIPVHNKKNPQTKRIEYRPPDPTSNIYLVESALLLAGLDGIKKKIQPPDSVDVNTYKLSVSKMKSLNIKKLPTSLNEAINAFKSDSDFLKPVIGADFMRMYLQYLKN